MQTFESLSAQNAQPGGLKAGEGYLNTAHAKIWYKISGESGKTPVILVHGGPGGTSYYLNPLLALGTDRPVILYDQSGCGRSSKLPDTSLMTIDHYVNELEELRSSLGIEKFVLYGQSWGTVVAVEYYFRYPDHVQAIILSSPLLNVDWWIEDADTLISTLPSSLQSDIRENEKTGNYQSEAYTSAMQFYYQHFISCRLPWSADIENSFANLGMDVYQHMWGPSEFTCTGTLRNYNCCDRLKEIRKPVLYIAGEFDEARPSTVSRYQKLTPGSKFIIIKNAGHLTMQDNGNEDITAIREFLDSLNH